ncbi:MAG: AhpC/TSA family protein [Nitrospirae bacterium]|nr:AhpC/TSA family protein [Nitrospirota bacterium]
MGKGQIPGVGASAPDFEVEDGRGRRLVLAKLRGEKVLLVFLRHLGCPVCRLEISQLQARHAEFERADVRVIVFVESPEQKVQVFCRDRGLAYHLVGDPDRRVYLKYGVQRGGVAAFLSLGAAWGTMKALARGHAHGRFEGHELQLPGDFVIDRKGRVAHAYLGRHVADNTPVDRLLQICREME